MMEHRGLSQRRACELVGLDRSTLRYRCRRPDDSEVRQRLRELAAERRRFGYRRLGWLLAREGHALNHKKLYRLYREERLMVRRRRGRKRALGTRAPMTLPIRLNQRWSLDFVSDTLSDGRRCATYLGDDLAGLHGALAALASLRHRDASGEGQHIGPKPRSVRNAISLVTFFCRRARAIRESGPVA